VYPAASVPLTAVQSGAKLMIINRDETPLDSMASLVIHESVSHVLGDMLEMSTTPPSHLHPNSSGCGSKRQR